MEKNLVLKRDTFSIPAVLSLPKGEGPFPAVVLCHGTGSEKGEVGRLFKRLARALSKLGIASIRFDLACCGERIGESDPVTFLGEIDDTKCAYDALIADGAIDNDRIGILGFSQGARIMTCFAGKYGGVKALVSWSGTCHDGQGVYSGWFDTYREEAEKNGFVFLPLDWREPLLLSKLWFDEVENTYPMQILKKLNKPILAVGGTADAIVPTEHISEIAGACGGRAVIIDGADHTFNVLTGRQDTARRVIELTADYFNEQL